MTGNDDLRTADGILLPASALAWRFDRAGGPGGQHRNKVHTRATVCADLEQLQGPPALVERVRRRLGPSLTVSDGSSRSQWQNRMRALERLADALENAAKPSRTRRNTRPGKGAVEKRLSLKRRTSRRKRERRRVDDEQ